jgi:GTPase SAR1 family protein
MMRKQALSFLFFDLTEKDTFAVEGSKSKGVEYWYNDYSSRFGMSEHTMVLIGNKADLKENRQVLEEDTKFWAKDHGMLYFEISALNVAQVNHVVNSAIQVLCKKVATDLSGAAFNAKQWEKNGFRILGDLSQIDLSGIIDYDGQQKELPEISIIAVSELPVIGEEEEGIEDGKDEKYLETQPQEKDGGKKEVKDSLPLILPEA